MMRKAMRANLKQNAPTPAEEEEEEMLEEAGMIIFMFKRVDEIGSRFTKV